MRERVFQRPETVPVWVEVKDPQTEELYDPSEGVLLTIYTPPPDMDIILEEQAMTKQSTGIYLHEWNSSLAEDKGEPINPPGWYKYRIFVQDGVDPDDKRVVVLHGFQLQ
jgi:hypothetical protein